MKRRSSSMLSTIVPTKGPLYAEPAALGNRPVAHRQISPA
jgi:hypothetical protein